jgi:CheY-like chemotaxis protein
MKKINILIVDDDFAILESFKECLEDKRFNVLTTSNPIKGLELFKQNQFDLILLDYSMPEMTGIQILELIRRANKTIPVFLMTSFNGDKFEEIKKQTLVLKGQDCFKKDIIKITSYIENKFLNRR